MAKGSRKAVAAPRTHPALSATPVYGTKAISKLERHKPVIFHTTPQAMPMLNKRLEEEEKQYQRMLAKAASRASEVREVKRGAGVTTRAGSKKHDRPDDQATLSLSVQTGPHSPPVWFKLRQTTPLQKLVSAYCLRENFSGADLLLGEVALAPELPPAAYGLKDGDALVIVPWE